MKAPNPILPNIIPAKRLAVAITDKAAVTIQSACHLFFQTNGKIEAFWKILKNEFFSPNHFESMEDVVLNLGNFLFEYNHLRKHGGLNYETPFDKLQRVTELVS